MSQNQAPKNTENLNNDEAKKTTGGSLLGGDDNMIKGVTQGYVNISNTDDDGDTSSTNLDFGSGSLLDSKSE
jgi:hypothetical protein